SAGADERRTAGRRTAGRRTADHPGPTPAHGLFGLAFSGGGIRSAILNLGIAQALHERGVFAHVDYMSTVSGGGYLGASLSTLMRRKTAGAAAPPLPGGSLKERFDWRIRPAAFLLEMGSRLDEVHRWVNLSDGGHIENMAAIELLRRRCKFVVIGDGEADPELSFNGLATLIRYARIDLGIRIDIDLDALRLGDGRRSQSHFAVGRIRYPFETEDGYLLYLKSSFSGDEDEVVKEYRAQHPDFPHEPTADQFFDEGQFEAYRALGQHVAECALAYSPAERMTFADVGSWFEELGRRAPNSPFREDAAAHS
ncbi:MAG TPA: patatin-like phospholipase family protein, partial [Thermoanaerobaculia bacterium]